MILQRKRSRWIGLGPWTYYRIWMDGGETEPAEGLDMWAGWVVGQPYRQSSLPGTDCPKLIKIWLLMMMHLQRSIWQLKENFEDLTWELRCDIDMNCLFTFSGLRPGVCSTQYYRLSDCLYPVLLYSMAWTEDLVCLHRWVLGKINKVFLND